MVGVQGSVKLQKQFKMKWEYGESDPNRDLKPEPPPRL